MPVHYKVEGLPTISSLQVGWSNTTREKEYSFIHSHSRTTRSIPVRAHKVEHYPACRLSAVAIESADPNRPRSRGGLSLPAVSLPRQKTESQILGQTIPRRWDVESDGGDQTMVVGCFPSRKVALNQQRSVSNKDPTTNLTLPSNPPIRRHGGSFHACAPACAPPSPSDDWFALFRKAVIVPHAKREGTLAVDRSDR